MKYGLLLAILLVGCATDPFEECKAKCEPLGKDPEYVEIENYQPVNRCDCVEPHRYHESRGFK